MKEQGEAFPAIFLPLPKGGCEKKTDFFYASFCFSKANCYFCMRLILYLPVEEKGATHCMLALPLSFRLGVCYSGC
jgi:hypothetical protein